MTQSQRKRLRDRLDRITARIVRHREFDICEVCESNRGDQQHHVLGKTTNALHFYIPGIVWVCWNCHVYLGDSPEYNKRWYIEKYGQPAWDKLVELRRTNGVSLEEVEESLKREEIGNDT